MTSPTANWLASTDSKPVLAAGRLMCGSLFDIDVRGAVVDGTAFYVLEQSPETAGDAFKQQVVIVCDGFFVVC